MRHFRVVFFLVLMLLCFVSFAFAVTVHRYAPETEISIEVGQTITFSIGASDPQGLIWVEWYVGSSYQGHNAITGYYDEDTWDYTFNDTGVYDIFSYAYNVEEESAFTWWRVTVGEIAPVEKEFWDDFQYSNADDPELDANGWNISEGLCGPPAGATCLKDNIAFSNEAVPDNSVMTLTMSTSNEFSDLRCAGIQTKEYAFLEGTYATRVRFTDSPAAAQDSSVQTFYSLTGLVPVTDQDYSETDFEYLPYGWGGSEDHAPRLDMTTWERIIPMTPPDNDIYDNAHDSIRLSFEGWHTLVYVIMGGQVVEYFVDGKLTGQQQYSKDEGNTVYPETPMHIAFNHWLSIDKNGKGMGDGTQVRDHTYAVDWVYHAKDRLLSPEQVQLLVNEKRAQNAPRHNSIFNIEQYTITYLASPGGNLSGATSQTVELGGDGTEVTAIADEGYHFVDWSDGVTSASRSEANVINDISVTADFIQNQALQYPDLIVGDPTVNQAELTTGELYTFSANVENQGDAQSNSTTLRYFISGDASITIGDCELSVDSVDTLIPGATSSEHDSNPAPTSAGKYWVGACVDFVNGESDTTNNCSVGVEITVSEPQEYPDLIIDSVNLEKVSAVTNEIFEISATVQNVGSASSNSTTLHYFLSNDATITNEDTELNIDLIPSLLVNSISDQSASASAPDIGGEYWIGACVDSVSNENQTGNNCSVGVQLTVTKRPVTPGDFDDNGIVNYLDLQLFADHWLFEESNAGWDILFNLDKTENQQSGNQIINYLDLSIFADHWLETNQ